MTPQMVGMLAGFLIDAVLLGLLLLVGCWVIDRRNKHPFPDIEDAELAARAEAERDRRFIETMEALADARRPHRRRPAERGEPIQ